jgi:hypothetical protein
MESSLPSGVNPRQLTSGVSSRQLAAFVQQVRLEVLIDVPAQGDRFTYTHRQSAESGERMEANRPTVNHARIINCVWLTV